jgi:hypothetical protein
MLPLAVPGADPPRSVPQGFSGQLAEVDLRLLRSIPHCGHARRFRRRRTGAGQEQVVDQHRHLVPGATTAHPPVPSGPRRRLTPEGRGVLNATDDLLRDIDRFRDRINIASGVLSGRFALHVIDNILIYGETGIIDALEFARQHPQVFISMTSASAADIEHALLDGRATAALTLMPNTQPSLRASILVSETLHLYCGRRHALFDHDGRLTLRCSKKNV